MSTKKVGIVVGSGTGEELAEIFKRILKKIAQIYGTSLQFIESDHIFNTYNSIRKLPLKDIQVKTKEDVKILSEFYNRCLNEGCEVIFRTAINAEALYYFRRKYMAIKLIEIFKPKYKILILRDETQGYYANDGWVYSSKKEELYFKAHYRKKNIEKILKFGKKLAEDKLEKNYKIWVTYKHHLFGNIFEKWVKEIEPEAYLFQPNSMIQNFFENYLKNPNENLLMIMGNEVGDISHEFFIYLLNLGQRKDTFSKSVYLSPHFFPLVEYATTHGSADELAGKNLIDPTAAIKIAADIAENFLRCKGIIHVVEKSIKNAKKLTQRKFTTSQFVESVEYFIVNYFSKNFMKKKGIP